MVDLDLRPVSLPAPEEWRAEPPLPPEPAAPPAAPGRARRRVTRLVAVTMVLLFAAKMANYLAPQLLSPTHVISDLKQAFDRVTARLAQLPVLHHCEAGTFMEEVPGGYVCSTKLPSASVWASIYDSAPIDGGARAAVYSSTDAGSLSAARDLLRGRYDIPRYAPVDIPVRSLTWTEDPYQATYWRLEFYSLRPTEDLLYAYRTTADPRYARALLAIDDSFFTAAPYSANAWSDEHAVAFRAMVLVDTWWRLRQGHVLSESQSELFLRQIALTGRYLADPNHYQPQHNHGVNEAAALLQIAVDYPSLPDASAWRRLALTRLDVTVNYLVDPDGVLVENSPYYEFYALDKLWQIYTWAQATHVALSTDYRTRLFAMIRYATYILQPDSSVPLLGASLETTIHNHGDFAQMAAQDPNFEYVLTHGEKGTAPPQTSVFFTHSGEAVLRSGWGKGADFTGQSYLTFNVGPYRTTHSNLDALSVTLFGNGLDLLPGAGLYTYSPGPMRQYFHGTSSHDTVVVDGKDQAAGNASAGPHGTIQGITYQSGESSLYAGVTHRRIVMMLDPSHYLVVDRLSSAAPHTYEQMWHLFAGAHVSTTGLTVTGSSGRPGQSITISQVDGRGISEATVTGRRDPPAGLCSRQYQVALSCPSVSYAQHGTDVQFTTLLTIGHSTPPVTLSTDRATGGLVLYDGSRVLRIHLTDTAPVPEVAWGSHTDLPPVGGLQPLGFLVPSLWQVTGGPPAGPLPASDASGRSGIMLSTSASAVETATLQGARLDASASGIDIGIKVSAVENLSHLDIELSNGNWSTVMADDLRNAYAPVADGEWLDVSLGRGQSLTGPVGHWAQEGPGAFDWSKVDGVRLVIEGKTGLAPVTVEVDRLVGVPAPATGKVLIVFDDGYQSILPAAAYLHKLGMSANIAVIAKYVQVPSADHLNVEQLRRLQNSWGWNMVNHTQNHADGVEVYANAGNLPGYQNDVVSGAQFLERAGLNSAPNWFIYPHGDTDDGLKSVLSNLYRFARTTQSEPTAYPFADPLGVMTLEVESPQDAEGGAQGKYTSPAEIAQAVSDAKRFGNTLILTFHRIHATATDPPGYSLSDFEAVADGLKASGVAIMTFSQLDRSNGIPENNRIEIRPAIPSQIRVGVQASGSGPSLWSRMFGWL